MEPCCGRANNDMNCRHRLSRYLNRQQGPTIRRNAINSNAISDFSRFVPERGIVENDEKLCSHCHMSLLILGTIALVPHCWFPFYRCLVVCITTSNIWTDKRKEKFSIWENTLCKYCSLVFIYIKSQGAGFESRFCRLHDIAQPSLKKILDNASRAFIWVSHLMLIELCFTTG